MPRYDRAIKTANQKFLDYLESKYPGIQKSFELKGKLISLDMPSITQREFDALMIELKRKFPEIF